MKKRGIDVKSGGNLINEQALGNLTIEKSIQNLIIKGNKALIKSFQSNTYYQQSLLNQV
jgi:hypothetical protein